jgi:Ser/Thr protein kinase RdoA (MazF antagonist)
VYASIPEAAKQAIQQLDLIPVYNDWYPDNILMLDRNIVGLIDFDSVVAAPYILDLQNALLYAAGTRSGFDAEKIRAFIQGYVSVRPLCRPELELIHPLMIDRIMFLVARAMKGGWPEADRRKDGLIAFLGRNLAWMVDHQEDFREHLAIAASTASSPRPPRIGLQ